MKENEIRAFDQLRGALASRPVLSIFNQAAETEVHTDASMQGYGAVLLQRSSEDGHLHPVYFMSKKTTDAEKKYSSYELEILAVVEALKKFRVYLLGSHFKLVTDCNAFAKTLEKKDLCTRVARWILLLEEYDYTVEHRSGVKMQHVDALSRNAMMLTQEDQVVTKIRQAQHQDEELKAIREELEICPMKNDFFLKGNILYKLAGDCELLVVPKGMQREIIRRAHDRGHFGIKKTKDLISKEYFIPKLEEKIQKHIDNCVQCIVVNRKQGKREGLLHPLDKGDAPLHTYHIDFIGPLETTSKLYKHILVVVDAFSKFCWLYPTKTTSASSAISKLQAQSVSFGNPEVIVSDRGSAFTSDDFERYCNSEHIRHIKITTGLPRANGQVERLNAVVSNVLAKLSVDEPAKWYKFVDKVQQFINATHSRATNTIPFELLVGVKMRTKEDLHIQQHVEAEMLAIFNNKRHELRRLAKEQILKTQNENKKCYNLRRKVAQHYKEGDLVAIKRTQFGGGLKLKANYLGPYRITKKKHNDTYEVIKVGNCDGPIRTSTCAEYIKNWPGISVEDDEDAFGPNA